MNRRNELRMKRRLKKLPPSRVCPECNQQVVELKRWRIFRDKPPVCLKCFRQRLKRNKPVRKTKVEEPQELCSVCQRYNCKRCKTYNFPPDMRCPDCQQVFLKVNEWRKGHTTSNPFHTMCKHCFNTEYSIYLNKED